ELERQRAETVLRESERKFRQIVHSLPGAVYLTDAEGHLTLWNDAAVALWGRVPEEGVDRWCGSWRLYEPDGVPLALEKCPMAVSLKSGNAVRGHEVIVERPNGSRSYALPFPDLIRDESGRVVAGLNMLIDITERRAAEEGLRESAALLRLAGRTAKLGAWTVDAVTGALLMSEEARDILAMPPTQDCNLTELATLVSPEWHPEFDAKFRRCLTDAALLDLEVRLANGKWARWIGEPWANANGRVVRAHGSLQDVTEQHNAAETLRVSEQKYRDIIEFTPAGFVESTTAGKLVRANRAFAQIFGYQSAEEVLSPDVEARHLYADPQQRGPWLETLMRSGAATGAEFGMRKKDGSAIWVEMSARSVRNSAGDTTGVEEFVIDIDQRKRAEAALIESEERYRSIVEAADELIFTMAMDGTLTSLNPAFERTTRWRASDWIGKPFWGLVDPSDYSRIHTAWNSVSSGTAVPDLEFGVRTSDGEIRILQGSAVPTLKDGKPILVSGIGRDVTDWRTIQREREDLIRRLELILESTEEGIYAVDGTGTCTMVNRAAASLLEYDPSELTGRQICTLIHRSEACVTGCSLLAVKATRTNDKFSTKSGREFPVDLSCGPLVEGGAVVTFSDITRRKLLETQLERANRIASLGRVAATIAHEFNNVLMGILPFAEIITRKAEKPAIVDAAKRIAGSVARGKRVTQEILRFTKPVEPSPRPLPVGQWLQEVEPEARSLLPAMIELDIRHDREGEQIMGDRSQLQQVLINLIVNSRDAIARSGAIGIAITVDGDETVYPFGVLETPFNYTRTTVTDNGCGMSVETMSQIFEPLFTTKRTGTGLGLAVTHQIVKQHGGEIFVESQLGVGTKFHVFLPRA